MPAVRPHIRLCVFVYVLVAYNVMWVVCPALQGVSVGSGLVFRVVLVCMRHGVFG